MARRRDALTRALAGCRPVWAGVAVFSACLNVLMLATPLYMMQVYDRVLTTGSVDTLLALTVMVGGALAVYGVLEAVRVRVLARAGAWLDRELGSPVLGGAVGAALRAGGGVSAQGLRDLAAVRGYLGGPAVMPLFDAPWAPVFLGVVFLVHPVLGWIGLGGALALFGCAVLNDFATRRKLSEANGSAARALNSADAAVRNADAIAAMGMLPALARRWRESVAGGIRLQTSASDASGSIAAFAKVVRFGLQVAMLGVGAWLVLGHEMTPGGMIAAAVILARGLAPLEQLITAWRALVGARTAWRRLRELMDGAHERGEGTSLPRPAGRVEVEQVGYVPPGVRDPVLRRVSFRLAPGEALGIAGPSGAGKTTLVRLLVGSLAPTAGHVRLDGADMTAWPRSAGPPGCAGGLRRRAPTTSSPPRSGSSGRGRGRSTTAPPSTTGRSRSCARKRPGWERRSRRRTARSRCSKRRSRRFVRWWSGGWKASRGCSRSNGRGRRRRGRGPGTGRRSRGWSRRSGRCF